MRFNHFIRMVCPGVALVAFSGAGFCAKDNPTPYEIQSFARLGVTKAWKKYPELSWGKGQCLAILDDGCDLSVPEWQVELPWGPKVLATYNSIDDNADPTPVPPGYHGTSVGYPSSLNYEGKHGVAFDNQVAQVRCVTVVHLRQDEAKTMAKALEWVLENREKLGITAVNLSPLDDQAHTGSEASAIDGPLRRLREAGVWVSAPCGNNGFVNGISWPASATDCFAIGASNPNTGQPQLDRFSNTDILVPASATSSSNALIAASAMVLRQAIEKTGYAWKYKGETLPDAMMAIFQETGKEVRDPETGLVFREANLLQALDFVYGDAKQPAQAQVRPKTPGKVYSGKAIFDEAEWVAVDFQGQNSGEFAELEDEGLLIKTNEPGENSSYFLPAELSGADAIEVVAEIDLISGIHRLRLVLSTGEEYLLNLYSTGVIGVYAKEGYQTMMAPEGFIQELRVRLNPAQRPLMQIFVNGDTESLLEFSPRAALTGYENPGLTLGEDAGEYDGECLWKSVSLSVSRPVASASSSHPQSKFIPNQN